MKKKKWKVQCIICGKTGEITHLRNITHAICKDCYNNFFDKVSTMGNQDLFMIWVEEL
jgi:hypothetical protein